MYNTLPDESFFFFSLLAGCIAFFFFKVQSLKVAEKNPFYFLIFDFIKNLEKKFQINFQLMRINSCKKKKDRKSLLFFLLHHKTQINCEKQKFTKLCHWFCCGFLFFERGDGGRGGNLLSIFANNLFNYSFSM